MTAWRTESKIALNHQLVRVVDTEGLRLKLNPETRLVNNISGTSEKASIQKKSFIFFSSL